MKRTLFFDFSLRRIIRSRANPRTEKEEAISISFTQMTFFFPMTTTCVSTTVSERRKRALYQYHSRENESISGKIFCSICLGWGKKASSSSRMKHILWNIRAGWVQGPTAGSITSHLLAWFSFCFGWFKLNERKVEQIYWIDICFLVLSNQSKPGARDLKNFINELGLIAISALGPQYTW